jgi:hypothetical protein
METHSPLAAFVCCVGILAIMAIAGMSLGIGYGALAWLNRRTEADPRNGCAVLAIAAPVFVILLTAFWNSVKNIPLF